MRMIVAIIGGVVVLGGLAFGIFIGKTSGRLSELEKAKPDMSPYVTHAALKSGDLEINAKSVTTKNLTADTATVKGVMILSKISTGSGDPFKPEAPDVTTSAAVKQLAKDVGDVTKIVGSLATKVKDDADTKAEKDKLLADLADKLAKAEAKAKADADAAAKAKAADVDPAKALELGVKGVDKILDDYVKSRGGLKKVTEELDKISSKIKKILEPEAPKKEKAPKEMPPATEEECSSLDRGKSSGSEGGGYFRRQERTVAELIPVIRQDLKYTKETTAALWTTRGAQMQAIAHLIMVPVDPVARRYFQRSLGRTSCARGSGSSFLGSNGSSLETALVHRSCSWSPAESVREPYGVSG